MNTRFPKYGDIVIFRNLQGEEVTGYLRAIDIFGSKIEVVSQRIREKSGSQNKIIFLNFWMYREENAKGADRPGAWRWQNDETVRVVKKS